MKNTLRNFCVLLVLFATACSDNPVDDGLKKEIRALLESGASFDDPFVRAETVRIVTELEDPALVSIVQQMKTDQSPMVRVAVLRALISTGDESARSLALNSFTNGKPTERRAILEAVYEYGDAPLKAELTARALRSKNDELKRIAFQNGYISRIDEAIEAEDDKLLERTLFPELGRFVTQRDPQLAAQALRKLAEVGQSDRAAPLVETLQDPKSSAEDKLVVAKILAKAGSKEAKPAFKQLIADHAAALKDTSLGVPDKIAPPAVLRWAHLGLAATGDPEFVSSANKYRIKASAAVSIEVLEALAYNPSEDALIAIRNAMKDARVEVRQRAIELYSSRNDADASSLNDALSGADHDTSVRLSRVLIDRFAAEWIPYLRKRLKRTSEVGPTLKLLRDVLTSKEDATTILVPLKSELEALTNDPKKERAQIARYLLSISDVEKPIDPELLKTLDNETLYGFLEFAGKASPATHRDVFKTYFYGDLFAIRLASSAGLWRAAEAKQE